MKSDERIQATTGVSDLLRRCGELPSRMAMQAPGHQRRRSIGWLATLTGGALMLVGGALMALSGA